MVFSGRVQLRSSDSSRPGTGPPGEAEIQRLNPGRESVIRHITGWETLAPGSLNLVVEDAVVDSLARFEPTLEEPAAGIVYPPPYESIPKIRKAYWYYAATARRGKREEPVLVRRAIVPVRCVVELFSAVSLTETFKLVTNDIVTVEIYGSRRSSGTGA
jgi:hypothetical protein